MILKDLATLNDSALQQLCAECCPESQTLEFKRIAPGNSDRDKHEFLKDVCAMANAGGGDIVFGIEEANGGAAAILPIAMDTEDGLRRRLGQLLDAGIEPRLVGVRMVSVKTGDGFAFIIRIPASFDGPHRYHYNSGLSKFVMRNGTHTTELTYDQLRLAFDRTATLVDRAKEFLSTRLGLISDRQASIAMMDGPICIVHLVPVASLASRKQVDVRSLYSDIGRLIFADWGGGSKLMNLDGVVAYPNIEQAGVAAYTQVFRNGCFEAARHGGLMVSSDVNQIPSRTVSEFYRDATIRALSVVTHLGLSGPAVLSWAMLDVEGAELATGGFFSHRRAPKSDRKALILPESWIETMGSGMNIDEVIRPMLDTLWQCFGIENCWEYAPDGAWRTQR